MTNGERAAHAATTLAHHRLHFELTGDDEQTDAIDLIANLLHHLHAIGGDPIAAVDQAKSHFMAEAG